MIAATPAATVRRSFFLSSASLVLLLPFLHVGGLGELLEESGFTAEAGCNSPNAGCSSDRVTNFCSILRAGC